MNIISVQKRQAQKRHICNSCLSVIEVGETYVATSYADGGDIWTRKDHIICDKIAAIRIPYFSKWGDVITDGWLNDDMQDAGFQDKNEYLRHLENHPQ